MNKLSSVAPLNVGVDGQLVSENSLIKLGLGHEDRLPPLYHDSAEGRGELGVGHGAVEVGLHNGVLFFLKLEWQPLVAMCGGGDAVIFSRRVLDPLTVKPGPDKNHNNFSVTMGGSWVELVKGWLDLFIGRELEM